MSSRATGCTLEIDSGLPGNTVAGDFIGTDSTGTHSLENAYGVAIYSTGNTIGGTTAGARNVISGNTGEGILIAGAGATGNVVEGDYIGTDDSGNFRCGQLRGRMDPVISHGQHDRRDLCRVC